MSATFIYSLRNPETFDVRYVGKTDQPTKRHREHLSNARAKGTHKDRWIASLKREGLAPQLEILIEVKADDWQEAERAFIKAFREVGFDLTNTADGGKGGLSMSPVTKARIGNAHRGKTISPEARRKTSETLRGRALTTEHRRAISRGNIGRKHSANTRRKISQAHVGLKASAGTRQKLSVVAKARGLKFFGKNAVKTNTAKVKI